MDNLFPEDLHEGGTDVPEAAETTATASTAEDLRFNEQLTQLEGIVAQLESGQLDLEDSLKSYSQGVELISSLQAKLADAEQKVQVMMGEIVPEDQVTT